MTILVLAILALIVIQDFAERKIYWFLPLLLFVASCLKLALSESASQGYFIWLVPIINICIVSLFLLGINIYLKAKKGIKLELNEAFGMGDVAIMYAITPLFGYRQIVFVIFLGSIFGLIHAGINALKRNSNVQQFKIPFASWLGVSCSFFLASDNANLL